MHTEDDLRAVLGALEREAPDPARTLAELSRRRERRVARRRGAVIAAIAVVTLALAGGSLAAPRLFHSTSPAQPTPATSQTTPPPPVKRDFTGWRYRFAVDELPGMRVSWHLIGKDSDTAIALTGTEEDPAYSIEVFRPGVYDPTVARGGQPVDVGGRAAFYRRDMPCHCQSGIPGVAFEYAPNAWVFVRYQSPAPQPRDIRAQVLKVAAAVQPDRTTPVRTPFRVGYLPGGLQPVDASTYTTSEQVKSVRLTLTSGVTIEVPPVLGYGANLPVGIAVRGSDVRNPDAPRSNQVAINLGPFTVLLTSPDPAEDLERIARSITLAGQISDPNTWISAEEAFPAS